MNIKEEMLKNLSSGRHRRVEEIASILDPNEDYEYEHTQNIERVKTVLEDYKYNKSYVLKTLLILNGNIKLIPTIDVTQGFICLMIIKEVKEFNRVVKKFSILTYEPDARLYPNI